MRILKRINLLLFLFAGMLTSFNGNSQSFILKDGNNISINNGDTIVVTSMDTLYMETGILVENISSVGKIVMVQRIDLTVVPGAACFMMWGSMEYPPYVVLTPYGDSVAAMTTNYSFMAGYISYGVPGSSWYKFIFFDENNPPDSAWAIVQFNALSSTGTKEDVLNEVSLYPNPGNGILNLSFPSGCKSDYAAEVFNSTGDLILESIINVNNSIFCLDIRMYPEGIYFLKVLDHAKNTFKVWKIVKV